MKKISALIIDDHKMIRDGLRVMLEMHGGKYSFVIDEAESGEEGVEKAKKRSYDIILMDYQMSGMNGAEAAKIIIQKKPDSKIMALSNYSEYVYIDKMIHYGGVKGYILKNIGPDELIKSIETVLANKNYYSNEIALNLLKRHKPSAVGKPNKIRKILLEQLSLREVEILKLIAEENITEQIAKKLEISKRTVDTHRQNMMLKLNVRNTVGLIKAALQLTSQMA